MGQWYDMQPTRRIVKGNVNIKKGIKSPNQTKFKQNDSTFSIPDSPKTSLSQFSLPGGNIYSTPRRVHSRCTAFSTASSSIRHIASPWVCRGQKVSRIVLLIHLHIVIFIISVTAATIVLPIWNVGDRRDAVMAVVAIARSSHNLMIYCTRCNRRRHVAKDSPGRVVHCKNIQGLKGARLKIILFEDTRTDAEVFQAAAIRGAVAVGAMEARATISALQASTPQVYRNITAGCIAGHWGSSLGWTAVYIVMIV